MTVTAMRAWLRRQRPWLVVEPLPAYAPELNPVETLWSNLKGVELARLTAAALQEVTAAAAWRPTHPPHPYLAYLAYSFLQPCGLSRW